MAEDEGGGGGDEHNEGEELEELEEEQTRERAGLRPQVVHEVIRREGELELDRPSGALLWSGIAGGLAMGLSLLAEGLLRTVLPPSGWGLAATHFGYCFGFVATILSRQQLFTESTLFAIIPLFSSRDKRTLVRVLRLWGIVLFANLVGCLFFACILDSGKVGEPAANAMFLTLAATRVSAGGVGCFVKAIFAGWLVALLVWMMPATRSSRVFVIVFVTYLIGLAGFPHIVAGGVDTFYSLLRGHAHFGHSVAFLALTLAGNVTGGVLLVGLVNHGQVTAGQQKPAAATG
jgi:formate/nitrite transporter FocA (FNT family)